MACRKRSPSPLPILSGESHEKGTITVKRITIYPDLMAQHENPIRHTCDMQKGLDEDADQKKEGVPMPIAGIDQPHMIPIGDDLRLRKYDGIHDFAYSWYQDPDTLWMVSADRTPYPEEQTDRMYAYLNDHGELYFIEIIQNGVFIPVGDVAFWNDDMPIVIGLPEYRGKGIGKRVVQALIDRGRSLGFSKISGGEIYDWNTPSRTLFTSLGFVPCEKTEHGFRYELDLTTTEV